MCEICRKYLCPPACPSYVGRSAERGKTVFRCADCGKLLHEYDDYIIDYGNPYCLACKFKTNDSVDDET